MDRTNFRAFLEERGVLAAYIMNLLEARVSGSWPYSPVSVPACDWLADAFPWDKAPEGPELWDRLDSRWRNGLRVRRRLEVEAGMPFDDELGLRLALSEVEKE